MVVGLRGTLGLGVALALAVMLWRLVERTVAAVGAGRPAQADELLIGLTASLALACVLWLALGLVLGLLAQVPGGARPFQRCSSRVPPGPSRATSCAADLGDGTTSTRLPGERGWENSRGAVRARP